MKPGVIITLSKRSLVASRILFAAVLLILPPGVRAEPTSSSSPHYVFPKDANIIRVTDFGAMPDDDGDDTAALRQAVATAIDHTSRYASPCFVYFPQGTYLVSGPIESRIADAGWSGGWRAGMILIGESRQKTIIKLQNHAEGYSDPAKPKWVIATGSESDQRTRRDDKPLAGGGNRAFRHQIINLTIDTGANNPGAVALDFIANNRGAVENVTLRSGDGSGWCGLAMERAWPGPALIKDVEIDGFEYGVRIAHYQYSMTFNGLTLRHQRTAGLFSRQNVLAIENLVSDNTVPAIEQRTEHGLIVLLNGKLNGGDPGAVAVNVEGQLLVHDLKVTGYKSAIVDKIAGKEIPAGVIAEYATTEHSLGRKTDAAFTLAVKPTPIYHSDLPDDWVSPTQFGAVAGDGKDDTAAIQQAIDSGKPIVYLPNGDYKVSAPLIVRGSVRKIMGMESSISAVKSTKVEPLIRFAGEAGTTVILEHLRLEGWIEHDGAGTLALRHADFGGYRNTARGTGDMFFEDTIGKPILLKHPQNIWGRQINCEFGDDPLIENHGGNLWLLGYKTEGEMTCLRQTGGRSELWGTLFYPLGNRFPKGPALRIEGGAMAGAVSFNARGYELIAGFGEGPTMRSLGRGQIRQRSVALLTGR